MNSLYFVISGEKKSQKQWEGKGKNAHEKDCHWIPACAGTTLHLLVIPVKTGIQREMKGVGKKRISACENGRSGFPLSRERQLENTGMTKKTAP